MTPSSLRKVKLDNCSDCFYISESQYKCTKFNCVLPSNVNGRVCDGFSVWGKENPPNFRRVELNNCSDCFHFMKQEETCKCIKHDYVFPSHMMSRNICDNWSEK